MQENLKQKKYRVAIITPTPFHYHTPLYKRIEGGSQIDLTVYYCSDETLTGIDIERMYHIKDKMIDSEDLLQGHNYKFLKNYSPYPSYMRWPIGLINFSIWKEIKNNKYDVVIIQAWNNFTWWLIAVACIVFKTPYMFMTDANELGRYSKMGFKKTFKKFLLGNCLFKRARGFLTSGIANEEFYNYYGVSYKKMKRMPFSWGYDEILELAKKIKNQRTEDRKHLGIDEEDIVFLYVGRLSREKLPLTLIDAYDKVNNKNKKLFLVGAGPMSEEIKKYVIDKKIKGVRFLGFQKRPHLFNFYNVADALILPSEIEPWGIVVNEAMCFGLPIIASDRVGAAVDLVKDNYNGFIFPAGNVKNLAICIKSISDMTSEEKALFGERSLNIITDWVEKNNPAQRMLKVLELLK